jgi:hypothetical protein
MDGSEAVPGWPAHGWGLDGVARQVAREMLRLYPMARITSGRRSLSDQARAMAGNEAVKPGWIAATYVDSPVKRACVEWCAANRGAGRDGITTGLVSVMLRFSDADLGRISKHLSGQAFDVAPDMRNQQIAKYLRDRAAECGGKFLEREGGLVRWHFQA